VAAIFQRVCHEHRSHREQTEQLKAIHNYLVGAFVPLREIASPYFCNKQTPRIPSHRSSICQNFLDAAHYTLVLKR